MTNMIKIIQLLSIATLMVHQTIMVHMHGNYTDRLIITQTLILLIAIMCCLT